MARNQKQPDRRCAERRLIAAAWALVSLLVVLAVTPTGADDTPPAPAFKPEEIEQLVAPIALYPDALLAQVLMASTYPLEVVAAARWAKENPSLKDKALEDALQKQTWDPSVKSLTAFPQVLTMLNDKLDWTQKLGDAFLAQQSDVMDTVQRLRARANAEGNLKTTKEQKVTVEPAPVNVEQNVNVQQPAAAPAQTTIIKIEPADPQVVYVPTYNPTVVYGAWPYPAYPPYSYYPPGYVAATSLLSFGVGMAVGSAMWGGCNWGGYGGHNDVDIDVNNYNNFNKTNISNKNWNHNAEHRKGVQYRDKGSQQRYGRGNQQGAASREAFRGRADQGRKDIARGDADRFKGDTRNNAGRDQQGSSANRDRQASNSGRDRPGSTGRDHGGDRQPQHQQRDASNRASQRKPDSGAFNGAGNGNQARRDSDRGKASRQSASASGFGGGSGRSGSSMGSHGGSGRSGGGGGSRGGGGGSRGGGGGSRGGGGRGR